MKEKTVERNLILEASKIGMTLFKNEVGFAITQNGFPVHYGLCKGSSDLIGWRSVEITEDMIGKRIAQFCAVEVKKDKHGKYRATSEQQNFINAVKKAGGFGVVADCKEDLKNDLSNT
jgi:VRR-NUC domain.